MTTPLLTPPRCRHRAGEASPGVHHCRSPRLVGLKLVNADVCSACEVRDHSPLAEHPAPPRLLSCAHWGPRPRPEAAQGCGHPRHPEASLKECASCPDYLFPLLTPLTPPEWVCRGVGLPPRPQPDGWWHWPNVHEGYRLAANEHIRAAPPYPGGHHGRGVVVVGGGKYLASAYVTIRVLRHVGCRLPIELWHLDGEVDEAMRSLLGPYGVDCRDADTEADRRPYRFLHGHWWKGWQLKPYAIAQSRFREVLLLDADSYPTRDPEYLFDWPAYREHGAIFWPDLLSSSQLLPPEKWAVFGAEPRQPPFESGQLLIDKGRCWAELGLALWYNAQADFTYHILWGDKDTFNVAWRKLRRDYAMPRRACAWDTHTILQYGPEGEVLFQHRCQDKFRLGKQSYESSAQPFDANTFNPRLAHEGACFAFLDELRRGWGPPR